MDRRYSMNEVMTWVCEVLRAIGAKPMVAEAVSRHLVHADASGHTGHGTTMLPEYLRQAADGRLAAGAVPTVIRELPAHLLVDGHHGFGHYTMEWSLERAIEKAGHAGVCAVNVTRCGHTGRLGTYGLAAARAGAAVVICGGSLDDPEDALVAPYGAHQTMLGTNPIAYAHPSDPPFVLDMATSAMAYYNLLQLAMQSGRVPLGVLVDKEGNPTTDAGDVLRGGAMLPFGGHKGFGLSVAAALLGGLSNGTGVSGFFMLVVGPQVIGGAADDALRRLRSLETVLVPGDRARRHFQEARQQGITVSPAVVEEVQKLLRAVGRTVMPL